MENLLLEQYSLYKKQQLEESPFKCLLNADIEPNPHQINAFCAAIQALKTGGIILADEVGLGKTIEAGLVLNYVIDSGAKKVLISLPATLRKQWEVELLEKFRRQAIILDRYTVEHDRVNIQRRLENKNELSIVIASYDYSSKLIKRFPQVKWDFLIIDEAHNLRNVFHGTKRAKNLYDLTKGIPKILLTATPLQNSLTDLHGLVSFIDPRIFGSEKVFNRRFVEGGDYEELKQELLPVLYRTLRRDVGKYMSFSKRTCVTVDFHLSQDEKELYDATNAFLRRDTLYSIPTANRGLIILVIRKLLASSSFALVETFEVLEKRLDKLYEGTKSAYAQEGFDLFWGFVEDEIDEDGFNEYDDEETTEKKQAIQAELKIVRNILGLARSIKTNAKINALKDALTSAFSHQISEGLAEKAVVFTESKRTQKYIAAELRKSGYSEEDILLFNGDFDDAMTKEIYRAWQVKNFGKTNYGKSVEYKHATNMIAVGMDVDRLGLMVVTGQPKQNSEYIQATSRIGRSYPGLVVTLYNPYRPRDLSHYENFTGYHSQLYRFVEGTTATPFSARARDRVLHALVISAIRLRYPDFANNDGAAIISQLTEEQLSEVKDLILDRLNIIKPSAKADAEHEIDDFVSNWNLLATQPKGLKYYVFKTDKYNRLMNSYGEVCTDFEKATLRSMREVESAANMFYYTEE